MRRSAAAGVSGAGFIDPAVLARIDNLELLAKTVVDGFLNGLHRSPYLGVSLDFAEHRSYMPGDDIRRIDWRLYARSDRFYVKQFEAETNANVGFLLDVSRSMAYGSTEVTKLDYARYLTASLAYFSGRQRDRVGLYTFDQQIVEHVPPSAAHLDHVLHAISRAQPSKPGSFDRPLRLVAETFRRRGIMAIVSDFYEEPAEIARTLGLLVARGHDVVAFHVMDPSEIDFPFQQATNFQDLETEELMPVIPERLGEHYRTLVSEHIDQLGKELGRNRIDYVLLNTAEPLDHALFAYLSIREKKARIR